LTFPPIFIYADPMEELLSQSLTRREFITRLGVLLLGMTGIPSFLKTFGTDSSSVKAASTHSSLGFGEGPYGGEK